jgi:hypothetical protein
MANCLERLKNRIRAATNTPRAKPRATPSYFEKLQSELPTVRVLSRRSGATGFFAQEVLRFHSIAGTLLAVDGFSLDEASSVDERYITHILTRSLLENCFWIIYLFDNDAETANRYQELKNSFKREYAKLLNEPHLPRKAELEPADPLWINIPRGLDMNSVLAQIMNIHGNRLNYLYFVYRIASFDTHGKNLGAILEDVFGKQVNFPVLKITQAFELVANEYLVVLNGLRSRGEV